MNPEDRWRTYIDIEQLRELGFNKTQMANRLSISRTTLYKYMRMTPGVLQQWLEEMRTRSKKADGYEEEVASWLKASPDLSSAQVMDWLQERYGDIGMCESTIRNYVRGIREKHGIAKVKYQRQFEAVPDPPMGQQMQVDFGEMKLEDGHKQGKTLRFIVFVLSHSRYKYVEWLDRYYTTVDVIASHERAFAFFGGMAKEIVYDQDHLLVISENHGDILYTKEFAAYRNEKKFKIHLCRKQDPQSKGKVENAVKYVKYNFGRGRVYTNLAKLNEACLAWLMRTGNGKMHHSIKKIPAEVYALEKQHLQPVFLVEQPETALSITRDVRKDNTVNYLSNRYSLPLGTFDGTDKKVFLQVNEEGELVLYDSQTRLEIARHDPCFEKGKLIKSRAHGRDRTKGIAAYIEHAAGLCPDPLVATLYLNEVHKVKPRYMRDQLQIIEKQLRAAAATDVAEAFAYCMKNRLYGAKYLTDAVVHFEKYRLSSTPVHTLPSEPAMQPPQGALSIKVPIRDMSVYQRVMEGAVQ
ncbi:IS21 family transposase [Paenibacillus agricola]|uniref:IS21 family transposase n=1 Tax=Paenibacillus agricola TaxID=2716264 RepID=UPI001FB7A5DB|nr:IS21 family transposase [Paenibacillus agricola]